MIRISHADKHRRLAPRYETPENALGLAMNAPDLPEIVVTAQDAWRLAQLVGDIFRVRDRQIALLARELDRASIVESRDVGRGTVTMRSVVEFRSDGDDRLSVAMLVYPAEARDRDDQVSVLAPIGTALLGLCEGQTMPYAGADGRIRRLRVNRVLFQPEAAGMWRL